MERTLNNTIVKQGLIIAYYFSNRWYGKCLCQDCQLPTHPEADSAKTDKSNQGHLNYSKKKANPSMQVSTNQMNEKLNLEEPLKNVDIRNKKD